MSCFITIFTFLADNEVENVDERQKKFKLELKEVDYGELIYVSEETTTKKTVVYTNGKLNSTINVKSMFWPNKK